MKKDKEKIYTKTALKREYGCTDKMFEYLPEADKIWYGRYKSQRWDAWSQAKVDEFLAKPEVIAFLAAALRLALCFFFLSSSSFSSLMSSLALFFTSLFISCSLAFRACFC